MILSRDTIFKLDPNIKEPAKIILQLQTLFATPIGSVALDRDFGLDMSFIDMPIPTAQALLSAEAITKIAKYIPEVQATEISFSVIDEMNGECQMEVRIENV